MNNGKMLNNLGKYFKTNMTNIKKAAVTGALLLTLGLGQGCLETKMRTTGKYLGPVNVDRRTYHIFETDEKFGLGGDYDVWATKKVKLNGVILERGKNYELIITENGVGSPKILMNAGRNPELTYGGQPVTPLADEIEMEPKESK